MDLKPSNLSPREEGELEDGEICDDETEEKVLVQQGLRPSSRTIPNSQRTRKSKQKPHMLPSLIPQDFRLLMPYNRGPHLHSPFPINHRQQGGPSGPDRPPPPGLPLGPDQRPRSSFWERSHSALGRFRHRGKPNEGHGDWDRVGWGDLLAGGREPGRPPPGRYGSGENHNIRESPTRKKVFARNQMRKPVHNVAKTENGVDESFEDLLSKYKQIQLELECIRKEETMALKPDESPSKEAEVSVSISRVDPVADTNTVPSDDAADDTERAEKKAFQAFPLKPLRQKLLKPAELDALKTRPSELEIRDGDQEAEKESVEETGVVEEKGPIDLTANSEGEEGKEEGEDDKTNTGMCCSESDDSPPSPVNFLTEAVCAQPCAPQVKLKGKGKDEDEELSELQLRLLALQSASRKWQQQEQQVMKESKERIAKASQEKSASPSAGPPDRGRVTTRSASSAAAERAKALAKPQERAKVLAKPQERAKAGARAPGERGKGPAKPQAGRKGVNPGDKGPGSAAKQAFRKQQLHTWKLQQQREVEEKRREVEEERREVEEERRRREEEIRKIRDLSNQDEQYNRFMKLVGGKRQTRSKSKDNERKSVGKQGLDTSGNLYQYDNYDEVAMDTDSETNSPVPSPVHNPFADNALCFPVLNPFTMDSPEYRMDSGQRFLSVIPAAVPPPPPPPAPPLDEHDQPPKPPFADEEEEEEMLLRETCLMSMANKRVNAPEETSDSGPPSPVPAPASLPQPAPRGNLQTVSLNIASLNVLTQSRGSKFARGHHVPRVPLVLPRHKTVVVQLNNSDDSDSDEQEASSSTPSVFGGLEFMIKEARRTVEAAKPKAAAEKENHPVRAPDNLPAAKKAEYRLLREEIASREKKKTLKDQGAVASPAGSDSEADLVAKAAAELCLSEAEDRLSKHRELLQRDEAVLRQLLLQESRKKESLKAAEGKVLKLKEQLLASEKIVSANRTLLKKLQEQVNRVEHRVLIKKNHSVRLERELTQAQAATGRGQKRRADTSILQPWKLQRVDSSGRYLADLIAQKQRLQQLESEYALKIQKLKQAQALRHRGLAPEAPALPSTPPRPPTPPPPPPSPFPVPQPSRHDLTQDKLTLDSEDAEDGNEPEPAVPSGATGGSRRLSFPEPGASTKPKLELAAGSAAKDGAVKPTKATVGSGEPSELFLGLDVEALRLKHQQQARLGDLLLGELRTMGGWEERNPSEKVLAVDVEAVMPQTGRAELKPVPFGSYRSPLLVFRSYRFSPYFRTKEKMSLSSVTLSNTIEARTCFCRFDLTGTCNDDDCKWQHMRNCTFSGNQLFQDILSYNLPLIGCSDSSNNDEICAATEKYIKKLFGANKDRMGMDQKAVLLVSKVNESKRHIPPFTTCKDTRTWRPQPSWKASPNTGDDSGDEGLEGCTAAVKYDDVSKTRLPSLDVCVLPEDKRYFTSETDDISNLETSVLESPRDTQLWIKLAFKYLSQKDTSSSECLDAALNTLSRALEDNRDNPEIWCHYLRLFSRRGARAEVQEMCEMAVEHAADFQVWWTYLSLESSFEGKDYVCERLLRFLLGQAASSPTDKLSFLLLEALLYRVQLSLFTGRMQSALAFLQSALKSANGRSIADHLMVSDRALAWLSYIHLTEFDSLPASLYDPADSNPSRLVSTEPLMLPWVTQQDISTPPDILVALFQDAVRQCSDERLPLKERTLACLPLHTNLITLNTLLERYEKGVELCESLLVPCPESCALLDALANLHVRRGHSDEAVRVWLRALAECPHNAEIFYHACKFLITQDKPEIIEPLFRGFVLSFCQNDESDRQPADVLRFILGVPTEDVLRSPVIKKQLQEQITHQMPYLHLVHCCWQWAHGGVGVAVDAFESALGSVMQLDVLHKLWMDYLVFTSSKFLGSQATGREFRMFADLVQRCLVTVPSRLEVPFSSARYWSCFAFHNKVVSLYLSCLPGSQHPLVLERLRYTMPTNTHLALRLLHQEWMDGNVEHLKFQARTLSASIPNCLANWKIAITVEKELKQRSEVRLLYQQALQRLPLCATLWKDRLLFEAAEGGGKTDRLRKLVDKCQEVGVSLNEPLNLGSC
ncbi:zinc finger C3H1 domain-containing protein-like isoform X1 [Osmerus mordax]|uniref:zinc finger C3H1 domain-containing protein-like isoform X1 n=1 Tax=Osmerus mordax TaxID=8014 RepID=UPI00350EDF33